MSKKKLVLYGEAEINTLIHVTGGESRTTSLLVAEKFGKQHKNVLRAIEKLDCSEEFRRLNFEPTSYIDQWNRTQESYELTRDGFSFLVMGFTGKKAAEWKEKYISAFNRMEQEIRRMAIQKANEDWHRKRIEGKSARLTLTDGIKRFIEYAKAQGCSKPDWYYVTLTRAVYKALFIVEDGIGENFRDILTGIQLVHLAAAESIAEKALWDGMQKDKLYKEIYQLAKERVEIFVSVLGKSIPGNEKVLTA